MSIENKLLQFQTEIEGIKKDAKNPFFKSMYIDINGIIKAIQPTLTKCGISYTQMPDILPDGSDVLVTMIFDADKPDSFIKSTSRLIMTKKDMQQYGSAQTYARRYSLVSMLGLEAEDDDGNSVSGKTETKPVQAPPVQIKNHTITEITSLAEAKAFDIEKIISAYKKPLEQFSQTELNAAFNGLLKK